MSSNNFYRDELYSIYNIVQSSMLVYPKEVIIATLRDFFSKASFYHYSKDKWGFANTTDHTDLPPGADIPQTFQQEDLSTRLFIGENYREKEIFYPAILVKSGGSKYVPFSINREKGSIKYDQILYEDGYGNSKIVSRPVAFVTAGAWEGSIVIDIMSRSLRARDDLLELVGMCFSDITVDSLYDIGLLVKPPTIGSPSEIDDRNDKLFKQSVTFDIRTEWERNVPVSSIVESILFTVSFEDFEKHTVPQDDFSINTEINLSDMLINL